MNLRFIKTSNRAKDGSKYLENELDRLQQLLNYEGKWYKKGINFIAGIDEAGRGPLAGPVVAAAVILPKDILIEGVNDSKKVSEIKREKLYEIIIQESLAWSVGIVDNNIIDELNILNATRLAMKLAVEKLDIKPELLLIDAEELPILNLPQESIVKGDALSLSIAAASIIAKVTRDRIMRDFEQLYSQYGFAKHKGYGTAEHINVIKQNGLCKIHRRSFTKNFVVNN